MNITELKALAEKATPGPWDVDEDGRIISSDAVTDIAILNMANARYGWGGSDFSTGQHRRANAHLIAAANPAAILELIAQLEDAQGENRALRATEAGLRERVKGLEKHLAAIIRADDEQRLTQGHIEGARALLEKQQ